jgi:hypothetical protein
VLLADETKQRPAVATKNFSVSMESPRTECKRGVGWRGTGPQIIREQERSCPSTVERLGSPVQHALFLHVPSFFICSQDPVIWSRWLLTLNPSFSDISVSSRSIFSLSNSTIRSQSLQMMWL